MHLGVDRALFVTHEFSTSATTTSRATSGRRFTIEDHPEATAGAIRDVLRGIGASRSALLSGLGEPPRAPAPP